MQAWLSINHHSISGLTSGCKTISVRTILALRDLVVGYFLRKYFLNLKEGILHINWNIYDFILQQNL